MSAGTDIQSRIRRERACLPFNATAGRFSRPSCTSDAALVGGQWHDTMGWREQTDRGGSMIKIILIIAASVLWTSNVAAQKPSAGGPCTADERRLCAGIQPGRDSLRACFREHIHELSDACLLALARFSAVDKTCRDRLSQECTGVEPGQGRLESCLRSAAAKLDDYCKGALSRAIPGARKVR